MVRVRSSLVAPELTDEAHPEAARSSAEPRAPRSARPGSTSSSTQLADSPPSVPPAARCRLSSTCSTACSDRGARASRSSCRRGITRSSPPGSSRRRPLADAQRRLAGRARQASIARRTHRRPTGSASPIAWGLPYFRRYVPDAARQSPARRPPRAASRRCCSTRSASRAIRTTRCSRTNDVAFLLRSDSARAHRRRREQIADRWKASSR